jgi:hypothetical protein
LSPRSNINSDIGELKELRRYRGFWAVMDALDECLKMHKALLSKYLREVDWHILKGGQAVALQAEIVDALDRGGYLVQMGRKLLEELENAQRLRVFKREKLLQELLELSTSDTDELDEWPGLGAEPLDAAGHVRAQPLKSANVPDFAGVHEVG